MEDYTKYCDSESNTKEDAITSGKRTIGDLNAAITEASATINTLTGEIEELAAKISSADADLKSATSIREQENGDFTATEADLVETVDTLGRAIIVLKRGQTSFLQRGSKDLSALTTALSKVVEATWVNSHQKSVVQSLIQSTSEDEDLSLQPQATSSAFESQGGGILDTLGDMKDKAESTLSSARKDEMAASHSYEMLKQSLETELKTMKDRMAAASTQKAAEEESKASASEELASTQKTVAADTEYLANLKESCASKSAEWDARQKSAGEEIGAIDKAKEILEGGVKVFLQIKMTTGSDDEKRQEVTDIVRKLNSKHHMFAFSQLVSAAQSDPFGKVRGLIESMIDRLTKEAAEEADAKSFCDPETSKSKAQQAKLTADADKHAARIEKATANKAQLEEHIKALEASVAEMDAGQSEATKLRQAEHEAYLQASSDQKQSA